MEIYLDTCCILGLFHARGNKAKEGLGLRSVCGDRT